MLVKPRSEAEAQREEAARRKAWKVGLYSATCLSASERPSKRGNDMIETVWAVTQWRRKCASSAIISQTRLCQALKLRHCCEATDCLAQYEAGEVHAEMFIDREATVQLGIEKRRGYPERNTILDYRPASVIGLRQAG